MQYGTSSREQQIAKRGEHGAHCYCHECFLGSCAHQAITTNISIGGPISSQLSRMPRNQAPRTQTAASAKCGSARDCGERLLPNADPATACVAPGFQSSPLRFRLAIQNATMATRNAMNASPSCFCCIAATVDIRGSNQNSCPSASPRKLHVPFVDITGEKRHRPTAIHGVAPSSFRFFLTLSSEGLSLRALRKSAMA